MSDRKTPEIGAAHAQEDGEGASEADSGAEAILPLALVAHEIRGPLAVIHASIGLLEQLLTSEGDEQTESTRVITRMRRNAELIARVTEDLADLGRAQLGAASLERAPADLTALVTEAISSLPETAGARVLLSLPPVAPIVCDAVRVSQVVSNLVRNGLEHGRGMVNVGVFATTGGWTIAVENDGVIAPALRRRLFQPFARGDGGGRGFGVGLYLVRRLVEAHGGVVTGDSAHGRVRFAVVLPV